jgi:hypothetical protein
MKLKYITLFTIFLLLNFQEASSQGIAKNVRVGSFWARVMDSGDEGEGSWGWGMSPSYYDGFGWAGMFSSKAMFLGCKNWTDTTGTIHPVKVSGHGQWEIDDTRIWMPIADAEGYTIHRYMRYQPPAVVVDGQHTEDPYPYDFSDHVDPNAIPGTADIMLESWINTDMGLEIHQKVYGFSHKDFDDFQIYEWTFKNTGNADRDPEIELPNQTLEDVYFLRQLRYFEDFKNWASDYGWFPNDTLRILYSYPARTEDAEFDIFGGVDPSTGFIGFPFFMGEVILFASTNGNPTVNDPNQPSMTGTGDCDLESVTWHSNNLSTYQRDNLYALMSEGFSVYPGYESDIDLNGTKPGHHAQSFDRRGFNFPTDVAWWGYTLAGFYACGPFTLSPGDSFKVVWAQVEGMISPEKGDEIGSLWKQGSCTWGNMVPGGPDDILPPPYRNFPSLYADDAYSTALNNWAKDNWVFTGKDSIFKNASNAQKAWQSNLEVPAVPFPPSISITSLPDRIRIEWVPTQAGYETGVVGYKVYRALGSYYTHLPEDESQVIGGNWEMIFECGQGTPNALTNLFDDYTAQRGLAYYYYVSAVNSAGIESGKYLNMMMTQRTAHLLKPAAATLDSVRVVPNPFNLAASELQFTGEKNKILFVNLPMECTIRIFTESGDLVKTINHLGSGDESWGILSEEQMVSESGQIVVSGIYLAFIETPDGKHTVVKFLIVR